MRTKVLLILLVLCAYLQAANLNSMVVERSGSVTKLMPEIKGIATEHGNFGSVLSADGDYLAVGSHEAFEGRGAVSIYKMELGQWELMQTLDSAPFPNVSGFGNDVSMDGDHLIVGASSSDIGIRDSGAVIHFERSGDVWVHKETLHSPNPSYRSGFGFSVAIKKNLVIVGEPGEPSTGPGKFFTYYLNVDGLELVDVLDDIDTEPQVGTSNLKASISDDHVVLSKYDSNNQRFVRVYGLNGNQLGQYQLLNEPAPSYDFGEALAIDGDRLAVGDSSAGSGYGVVYIYEKNQDNWVLVQTINGPEGKDFSDGEFGSAVQLKGDKLLVGSYQDIQNGASMGAVFYYQLLNGSWQEMQKITSSDGNSLDEFGFEVLFHNDEVIVNALNGEDEVNGSGKLYQFELTGNQWIEKNSMVPLVDPGFAYFGRSMAMNDDWVAVGANGDNDFGSQTGAIYLYKKENGVLTFESKLYAESELQFGGKVIIDGSKMLVRTTGRESNLGLIYFYQLEDGNWVFHSSFDATETMAGDCFGYDMSLDGNVLVVSAPCKMNGSVQGKVYFFEFDGSEWQELGPLEFNYSDPLGSFGFDISLSGSRLVVGTYNSGHALVFKKVNKQWSLIHDLTPENIDQNISFGRFVKLSGNHLVIGETNSSNIYVYHFDGETLSAPYFLDEGFANTHRYFDIKDNTMIITDRNNLDNNPSGAKVYEWINEAWVFIHELQSFDSKRGYYNDVLIDGDEVLIGDVISGQRGYRNGAAYWITGIGDLIYKDGFE